MKERIRERRSKAKNKNITKRVVVRDEHGKDRLVSVRIDQDQSPPKSNKSNLRRRGGKLPTRSSTNSSKGQDEKERTSLSHDIPGGVAQYCPNMTFYQRFDVENCPQAEGCKWYNDSERVDQVVPKLRNRGDNVVREDWLSSFKTQNADTDALYHLSMGVVGTRSDALMSQTHFILPPAILKREKEVRQRTSESVFIHPLLLQHLDVTVLEGAVWNFAKRMTNSSKMTGLSEKVMLSGNDLWIGATTRKATDFIVSDHDDVVFLDYISVNTDCRLWQCSNLKNSKMLKRAVMSILSSSNQPLPKILIWTIMISSGSPQHIARATTTRYWHFRSNRSRYTRPQRREPQKLTFFIL